MITQKPALPESKLLEIIRRKKEPLNPSRWTYPFLKRVRSLGSAQAQKWVSHPLIMTRKSLIILTFLTIVFGTIVNLRSNPSGQHAVGQSRDSENRRTAISEDIGEESEELVSGGSPAFEYYLSVINKKNLFRTIKIEAPLPPPPTSVVVPQSPPPTPEIKKPTLSEMASDLALVGVINTGELQAIIINRRSNKTSYLSVGDMIGEIKILKIQENRVKIGYIDETMDLSL